MHATVGLGIQLDARAQRGNAGDVDGHSTSRQQLYRHAPLRHNDHIEHARPRSWPVSRCDPLDMADRARDSTGVSRCHRTTPAGVTASTAVRCIISNPACIRLQIVPRRAKPQSRITGGTSRTQRATHSAARTPQEDLFHLMLNRRLAVVSRRPGCPFYAAQSSTEGLMASCATHTCGIMPLPGKTLEALETVLLELARLRMHGAAEVRGSPPPRASLHSALSSCTCAAVVLLFVPTVRSPQHGETVLYPHLTATPVAWRHRHGRE